MPKVIPRRMTAQIEGDFVVFLIGMRINKPWKIHKWLPAAMAMPAMLKELFKNPDAGFLGVSSGFPVSVQYWRSFEQLVAYARSRDSEHFPAWVKFNKLVGQSGDVGIWHETYRVSAGQYETLYNNMPPFGLGKSSKLIPAEGRYGSSRSRAGIIDVNDAPISPEGEIV